MTIEQILNLQKAGFTADQITALAPMIGGDIAATPTPAAVEAVPPAQPEQPAVVAPASNSDPSAKILEQLQVLTAAVQSGAILTSQQPAVKPESAEDALAHVIL